jgi:signal transduction histidine kinase
MTANEIRPGQLRGLLLLLVLVPLIPTALMVRFMVDAFRVERVDAMERIQQRYAQLLDTALRTAPEGSAPSGGQAARLQAHLRGFMEPGVALRIVDSDGRWLAGERAPWGQPVAQAVLPDGSGGMAQIFLTGPEMLDEAVAGTRRVFIWTGAIVTLAVLLIAGTAALAVSRQIDIRELRSTSVATVAHEMRTPLASMRMLVDTLREGRYRGEQQLREYLDLIAGENDRLRRIAENFLTFSRLDRKGYAFETAPVVPRAVAEQAVASLRSRLEAPGCEFTFDVPDSLPPVRADQDALAQVLANLLDNALKYTGDVKRIALRASAARGTVSFSVEDNGTGIPAGERHAIFEPFHQVDRKLSRTREGSGLGLAIVQRIVEAHRGEIHVASEPGRGSIFTVKLPIA